MLCSLTVLSFVSTATKRFNGHVANFSCKNQGIYSVTMPIIFNIITSIINYYILSNHFSNQLFAEMSEEIIFLLQTAIFNASSMMFFKVFCCLFSLHKLIVFVYFVSAK